MLRPLLFSMGPDLAHEAMLSVLGAAPRTLGRLASVSTCKPDESRAVEAFGVRLAGPIGMAAGLDKDGVAVPFWPRLGFGFIEIGTVTQHAQPGNPKPRMFRFVEENALINRAGFNNAGSAALATRLEQLKKRKLWPKIPVGVNVGKSKITPLEKAKDDYVTSIRRLSGLADYFTVNVSSPNTPGLRELQGERFLEDLLSASVEAAKGTAVLLKLAPDLSDEALAQAIEVAVSAGAGGIIATNTTISREGLRGDVDETGGMSGRPLWPLARHKIGVALHAAAGRVPIVGVGGIHTAEQAQELLDAGCVAVQLYTAMIYEGPGLISKLNRDLGRHPAS